MRRYLLLPLAILLVSLPAKAQVVEEFRPMYLITGIPLSGPVNRSTIDVKFQFSLALPVWRNIGNREGMNLSLAYTQISVWDTFDKSSPFHDNAYIPGLYLKIPLQRDELLFGIEHRSNGRPLRGSEGDTFSRSANYVFGQYSAYFPCGFVLKAALRFGIGALDKEMTQEVFSRFLGYGDLTLGYHSPNGRWELGVTATPVFGPFNVNVDASVSYHLGAIALFSQFYYGYGEALADWVRGSHPAPHLRVGVMLGKIL
jgi:phospholipase A1